MQKLAKEKNCSLVDLQLQVRELEVSERKDIEAIRREVELKFEAKETALKLQAVEIERRLENLNHEAEQLKDMQSTYLPRELFEEAKKESDKKIESLASDRDRAAGRQTVYAIIIPLIVSLIFLLINLLATGKL